MSSLRLVLDPTPPFSERGQRPRTTWLGPLNKQAQGGHKGGGSYRGLQPCRVQTMQLGPSWVGPVLLLLKCASTKQRKPIY